MAQVDLSRSELAAVILDAAQALLEATIIPGTPKAEGNRCAERIVQLAEVFLDDGARERARQSVTVQRIIDMPTEKWPNG